jgi:hypothetical protein
MSEGLVSKFDVLLDAYFDARKNRKKVRAVPKGTSRKKREKLETSLSTEVGLTALDAELQAMLLERRALAKLRNHLRKLIPPA